VVPIQLPTPKPRIRFRDWSGVALAALGVSFAGASTACTLIWTMPAPLVLPAIGVLATLAAAAVALIAWLKAQRAAANLTYWDIAGALTLVGVVATLLSQPELALPFFDNQPTD
jgi:hypothetical protein